MLYNNLLKNKDFLLLTFKLLESSLKQNKNKKQSLPKKIAIYYFKCASRGTTYQAPWKTVTWYHQKDNSPETKLKVRIF